MLKGTDKGVVGENVRELKNQGLSETEAVLVSMKQSKKEKKASEPCCGTSSSEDYPYGLRLDLNDETLEKLGIDDLPAVGDDLDLDAEVQVRSVSENQYEGEDRRRSVTLQITKMKLV